MVTPVTVSVTPSTVTVNAEALGPVVPNVSLKVSTAAPAAFTADETKVGPVRSKVDRLFPPETVHAVPLEAASLPAVSSIVLPDEGAL